MISQRHLTQQLLDLAESLAGVRYRCKKYVHLLKEGWLTRFDYTEIDHCCQNFNLVDEWLQAKKLQSRGRVGCAEARLVRSRDIVKVVTAQLQRNETIFLHPVGVDEECDEARASLPSLQR